MVRKTVFAVSLCDFVGCIELDEFVEVRMLLLR
jgi:hypothetical protein